jgi:hypothetical protein
LDDLVRYFAIKVKPLNEDLYHLSYDQKLSPVESLIVQDCVLVVVTTSLNIVGYSFAKMFDFQEEFSGKFPNEGEAYEHLDGIQALLFYHNKWIVTTNPYDPGVKMSN